MTANHPDRSMAQHGATCWLSLRSAWPAGQARRARPPAGQLTYGVHISLAPTWFDPAETPGLITPFMLLYALHDAW